MSSNNGKTNLLYQAFLLAAVAMLFFTVGKGCNKGDTCCPQVETLKEEIKSLENQVVQLENEKKLLENKIEECCSSSCEIELKYFVEREFRQQGKLVTGSYMIDLFREGLTKQGVQYLGPSCDKINGKYIISFHATGTSKTTKVHYDHYAKFEVNSSEQKIVPITEFANTMAPFLGL